MKKSLAGWDFRITITIRNTRTLCNLFSEPNALFYFQRNKSHLKAKPMKTKLISSLLLLVASGAFAASEEKDASKQLEVYPKNFARQNIGSNLFLYNPATQAYVPTEAAAAWLDDDVATGWPPMLGQHYYLVSLSKAELLTNFAILTQSASGTVSLYAGDEPAPPSSKSWAPLAKNLAVDSINGVKMNKPFSRFAKYMLVETNLTDSGPWYSLYLYGEKPATSFTLEKRGESIDTRSVFGPYVNNQVAFNASSLYGKARVTFCNAGEGFLDWQKVIDDNPESAISVAPSADAGVVIKYDAPVGIQRVSVLTAPSAKGKLEFFLKDAASGAPTAASGNQSQYIKVANDAEPLKSLDGLTPIATLVLTGASSHASADFAPTSATSMMVRWTPDDGKQAIPIREINSFDDVSLTAYQLSGSPEAIAENTSGSSSTRSSSDGKELADGKDGKGLLPPVSELLPSRTPFVPGSLGFPTNLPSNTPPVASLPPRRPPSGPPTPLSP